MNDQTIVETTTTEQEAEQRRIDEMMGIVTEETTVKTKTAKGWRLQRLTAKGSPSKASKDTTTHSTKKSAVAMAKESPKYSWLLSNLARPDAKPVTLSFQTPELGVDGPEGEDEPKTKTPAKVKKTPKAPKKTVPTVIALLRSNGMTSKSGRNACVVGSYPPELKGKAFFDNHNFGDEGEYQFCEFAIHAHSRNSRVIRDIKPASKEEAATWIIQALTAEDGVSKKTLTQLLASS